VATYYDGDAIESPQQAFGGLSMAVKFNRQQRDQYTVTTDWGLIGMIQRVGDRFAFVDARNLRPADGRLVQAYADELQEVVNKLKELDDEGRASR
jgi:hypothetical protein